jgi:hypothetical protein
MNSNSPALELRDIHLPEPISWWPPAPGWWLLLSGIVLLAVVFWWAYKQRQKKRARRDSLKALADIREQFSHHQSPAKLLRELSVLMRRSCITFYPRALSASLTGEDWLQFLDATSPNSEFCDGIGKALASAPYLPERAQHSIDSEALLDLCETWLRAQPSKNYLASMRASKPGSEAPR